MRLRLTAYPVSGSGQLERVLTPRHPLRNLWVRSPAFDAYGMITGSRADLLRLGALIRLAAISGHSAIHLPLAANALPADVAWWFRDGEHPVDLLIVRSDIGLRPSAWPSIRRRIHKGQTHRRPLTARTPVPRPVRITKPWEPGTQVSLTTHATTLVMSGPASSLHLVADTVTAAGEWLAGDRHIHRHGQAILSTLTPLVRDGNAGRPTELDIYGRDPIFHRRRWTAGDLNRKPTAHQTD